MLYGKSRPASVGRQRERRQSGGWSAAL